MRVARPLALHLRVHNVDPLPLLTAVGLTPRSLFAAEERVPMSVMNALWEGAVTATKDPLLGARLALMLDFSMFEHEQSSEYTVLQLMATSATVGDAFARLARFGPLGFGPASFAVRLGPTETEIVLTSLERLTPSIAEFFVLTHVRSLHLLPTTPVAARAVRLAHPPPAVPDHEAAYQKLVGIVPTFGAADHAIVVATADLATPIPTSRPPLVAALERRAEEELARTAPGHSLIDRVRSAIAR